MFGNLGALSPFASKSDPSMADLLKGKLDPRMLVSPPTMGGIPGLGGLPQPQDPTQMLIKLLMGGK